MYIEHGDTLEFNVSDLYREDSKDADTDRLELFDTMNRMFQWADDIDNNPSITMDSYVTYVQLVNGQPLVVERSKWRYLREEFSNLRNETIGNI